MIAANGYIEELTCVVGLSADAIIREAALSTDLTSSDDRPSGMLAVDVAPVDARDFLRVCRRHRLVLEERGSQLDPHLVCPGPPRHRARSWRVVDRRKGRALYEADMDRGATKIMDEKTTVADAPKAKSETIERAKFRDGSGLVLWLRIAREPKKYGGHPFRIKWTQLDGKKSVGGVTRTCADEPSGRAAFRAAVKSATERGWKMIEIGQGRRRLELRPIPAPKKRAAA